MAQNMNEGAKLESTVIRCADLLKELVETLKDPDARKDVIAALRVGQNGEELIRECEEAVREWEKASMEFLVSQVRGMGKTEAEPVLEDLIEKSIQKGGRGD
jgi:Ribonuclease G/E